MRRVWMGDEGGEQPFQFHARHCRDAVTEVCNVDRHGCVNAERSKIRRHRAHRLIVIAATGEGVDQGVSQVVGQGQAGWRANAWR